MHFPIHLHAGETLGGEVFKEIHKLALTGAHHGCQDLELQALFHGEHLVHDLLRGLALDDLATFGAVRHTGAGVEKAQVIEDFRHRTHGGTRVAVGGLLVDRHRRAQALDEVHVRLVQPAEEHARIRTQRFHVATLAFGEDGIESQRGFTGSGQPREHDHLLAGQVDVHALEVVLARTLDNQPIGH